MDYLSQQRRPAGRQAIGIGAVLAVHALLGWAVLNGLHRKIAPQIWKPVETVLIQELPPVPPPPPLPPPPPPPPPAPDTPPPATAAPVRPSTAAPPPVAPSPPPFVPPPEVSVAVPVPAPPLTVSREPSPPQKTEPRAAAAPALPTAPAPAAAAPPAAPRLQPVGARIDNLKLCVSNDDYPPAAARAEVAGTTRLRVTINANGRIVKAEVVGSAGPTREHRLLDRTAVEKLSAPGCGATAARDEDGHAVSSATEVEVVWRRDE